MEAISSKFVHALNTICTVCLSTTLTPPSDSYVSNMATTMLNIPYRPRVHCGSQLPNLESIYSPLGEHDFRLLKLLGYDEYGILRCSLLHAQLGDDATPPYSAISYTWNEAEKLWYGDYDTSPKPVRINGTAVLVSDKVANIACLAQQVYRHSLSLPLHLAHDE